MKEEGGGRQEGKGGKVGWERIWRRARQRPS